jgi:Cu+-exporting ATPase
MSNVYYDTSATIITLILLGKVFEARAKGRTSEAIKKLIGLQAKTARVMRNNLEYEIPIDEVLVGDTLVIRPGERIPTDGVIIHGSSIIDESMVTGESIPVEKKINDPVIGATINNAGSFTIRATKIGKETMLGQIVKMVNDTQATKAPIQRLADQIASVFVPGVIGIAMVTFLGWYFIGNVPFTTALVNFVAVLIIACPCALGLATPTAIMVGTGKGAEVGILIKDGASLEIAHRIDTIVLDKTGTITKGQPEVLDILLSDPTLPIQEMELLQLAAAVENKSEHPLAEAIVRKAKQNGIKIIEPDSVKTIPGQGVSGKVNGKSVIVGNEKLMASVGKYGNTPLPEVYLPKVIIQKIKEESTPVFIAIDGKLTGIIAIADPIKENSREAIGLLQKMGLKVFMITGDNPRTANGIARLAGIDFANVIANVLPEEKANKVKELQDRGKLVMMVGDGINDAPALAQADLGFAIGTGTDIAMEAGQITLLKGDLKGIVTALRLSHQTIRTIRQNLFWAFIYNVIGIPLAASGMLNPMIAAAAMAFSSVSVVSNSLRLKRFK